MADEKAVRAFRRGPEAWKEWRKGKRGMPDLRGADLTGISFSGGRLVGVDFGRASLCRADLSHTHFEECGLAACDLGRADLSGADFIECYSPQAAFTMANLKKALFKVCDLTAADFHKAYFGHSTIQGSDLDDANLRNAKLIGTVFESTFVKRTRFDHASLAGTVFSDIDFSTAQGLNSLDHASPTTIDHRTLIKSASLPLEFLQGCGLPQLLIDYIPSLSTNPVQFNSCFISYSTKDQEFAQKLHDDLQSEGVRCWFAPRDLRGGRKLHEQIDEAIRFHDRLLLILSPASMDSEWVKTEIAKARKREATENRRILFPVRLVEFEKLRDWECFDADIGKDTAKEIREYYIPDFSEWKKYPAYRKSFDSLLRDLHGKNVAASAAG